MYDSFDNTYQVRLISDPASQKVKAENKNKKHLCVNLNFYWHNS